MTPQSQLRLAFYGDDFTGATDVLESVARLGLKAILFLAPPTDGQLARHPDLQAMGIAGSSRTLSPDEMDDVLPPIFSALRSSGARLVQYKVCSTFDSSPHIGSIGHAIEIGRRIFEPAPTPLLIGAPSLGRHVVFGNLFARSGLDSEPARLDRHPTMRHHPITPMEEADLRVHLARQTSIPIELVDVLKLETAQNQNDPSLLVASYPPAAAGQGPPPILMFDTLNDEHLHVAGAAIDFLAARCKPLFCVGSSGLTDAVCHRYAPTESPVSSRPRRPVSQFMAVSGSCSPVTRRQMAEARSAGIALEALPPTIFTAGDEANSCRCRILKQVRQHLDAGRSVILHSCDGPDDPRINELSSLLQDIAPGPRRAERIGFQLAALLEALLPSLSDRRVVICGGDTSTFAARALGVESLEWLGPMAPGSPLCRADAPGRLIDRCEIVFKGGQVGRDSFFLDVLAGGPETQATAR